MNADEIKRLEAENAKLRAVAERARALLTCLETDRGFSQDKEAEELDQFPEATPWLLMRELRAALESAAKEKP